MAKRTRSIRLPHAQHKFIDESSFNFSEEVRDFIDDEWVKHATGICAICGDITYIGDGFVTTGGGSPLGRFVNLDASEEVDFCEYCHDDLAAAFSAEDAETPRLDYRAWWDDPLLYRADRDAIAQAQPSDEWATLVTENTAFELKTDRLRAIVAWARETDLEEFYAMDTVSAADLRKSLHEAVSDESDLRI